MAHTNETPHFNLPQFLGTDKASWIGDINPAMLAIDTALFKVETDSSDAASNASAAQQSAQAAETAAELAQSEAETATEGVAALKTRVDSLTTEVGTLSAGQTSQGASISTLQSDVSTLQTDVQSAEQLANAAQQSITPLQSASKLVGMTSPLASPLYFNRVYASGSEANIVSSFEPRYGNKTTTFIFHAIVFATSSTSISLYAQIHTLNHSFSPITNITSVTVSAISPSGTRINIPFTVPTSVNTATPGIIQIMFTSNTTFTAPGPYFLTIQFHCDQVTIS